MRGKTTWLVASSLMVLSLMVTACAPEVVEKPEVIEKPKSEGVEKPAGVVEPEPGMVKDTLGWLVKAPQYGGILNLLEPRMSTSGWKYTSLLPDSPMSLWHLAPANETLLEIDPVKGPGGTNEQNGMFKLYPTPDMLTGNLAERWEIIQPDTLKFKIRKGIHLQDKEPTYGREFTAEDVAYTFQTLWSHERSRYPKMHPDISDLKNPENSIYLDPKDRWTVILKSAPGRLYQLWVIAAAYYPMYPQEYRDMKAGEGPGTWQRVSGTGPYIVSNYVPEATITYKRNPNYWKMDPFHPANRLPYPDGMKIFFIEDKSTQQAAFRTGKIDFYEPDTLDEGKMLLRTNPELQYQTRPKRGWALTMRNDLAPFNNVKVRQAMWMAVDHDGLVKDYYGGYAEKFNYPSSPYPQHVPYHVPLEQMPEVVQQMYGYHPEKAKQLLAEAGYPNGFKFTLMLEADGVDLASVLVEYFKKVGITMELKVMESAAFTRARSAGLHEAAFRSSYNFDIGPQRWLETRPGHVHNWGWVDEPLINQVRDAVYAAQDRFDLAEEGRLVRENAAEIASLANILTLPTPHIFAMWQPWVNRYYGEDMALNYQAKHEGNPYFWIDQELKEK